MTHLTGMGVRVQLSTHLSARVVYTTDTPTSLYCMDAPTSLYDGGAYTGGCILGIGISDGSSMHSPLPVHHTVHACIRGSPQYICTVYIVQPPHPVRHTVQILRVAQGGEVSRHQGRTALSEGGGLFISLQGGEDG
jgi:hypothetical protein